MVSISQLTAGTMKFIDAEMLPALPANQRWIAGALLYMAQGKAEKIIGQLSENPILSALNIIGEGGMVDIETVRSSVKSACQKYGSAEINVPLIGQFELTEKNFDSLFKRIKAESANEIE